MAMWHQSYTRVEHARLIEKRIAMDPDDHTSSGHVIALTGHTLAVQGVGARLRAPLSVAEAASRGVSGRKQMWSLQ